MVLLKTFIIIEVTKLRIKYTPITIDMISMAWPVCINAVPAKTSTKSGYAIAAAKDEFFVKFRYWFVNGGTITLSACGMITRRRI